MHLTLLFLFNTWLGGVVCSAIALLIVGYPIVNWLVKMKKKAVEEAKHLKDRLHTFNQSHNPNNPHR